MHDIQTAIASAVKNVFNVEQPVVLTRPDEQFGDYATNVALQLAKPLGKSPREVAEALVEPIKAAAGEQVSEVSIAGPGFINVRLSDTALLAAMAPQEIGNYKGKKVLAEYSDPNPFKPLHAGHLYTTLVGDTIARLLEHAGASMVRLNYGGDVGLHVAKSMWAIMQELGGEYPERLDDVAEADRPFWLGRCYVTGNNAYEDNEASKAEIVATNKRIYELHASGDTESSFAKLYYTTRQWSYNYFTVLYDQLRVVPFDRYIPESEVTPLGVTTVEEQLKNGVFKESDGAVVFEGEPYGLHTRVFINSAGLPTYETKDVGLSLTKWQDYHFDESVIITANEQAQYMQVVIAAIKQFEPKPAERTRHLTHGFVKLQGGVKMSSPEREYRFRTRHLEFARQAGAASDTKPSEETVLAAVKYALIKNRIGGDIEYDPQESIALEGNSGPYLQYAHARACSILAKANTEFNNSPVISQLTADERSLVRKISAYSDAVQLATNELMPHHICTYLYELAQTFNRFYEHNRVIGDERETVRLRLVNRYADTLRSGLELLGISAPEKM